VLALAKTNLRTRRAFAGKRMELGNWKIALLQLLDHRLSNQSGCADDRDVELLAHLLLSNAESAPRLRFVPPESGGLSASPDTNTSPPAATRRGPVNP